MANPSHIEFTDYKPGNYLWPELVEKLGSERANRAVRQALDLQCMNGNSSTLPVLFFETCGLALTSIDSLFSQTGLPCHGDRMVLILSTKKSSFQLLEEY